MKTHLALSLVLLAAGSLAPVHAADPAPDPPYLREMPTVERVLADMKLDDPRLTSARQLAAFETLCNTIIELAGPRADRKEFTADERRIVQQYNAAYQAILAPLDDPASRLPILGMTMNMLKSTLPDQIRARYLSADTLAQHRKALGKPDDPAAPQTPAALTSTPPGASPLKPLRMSGTYVNDAGIRIDFQHDAAALTSGQTLASAAYTVHIADGKAVVTLYVTPGPVPFTLDPDGNLVGADFETTTADGKVERRNAGTYKPGAVLTMTAVLDAQAKPLSPIAKHEFYLLRHSIDEALTRGGFKPPAGMSPRTAMEHARIHDTPDRQKAVDALLADVAAGPVTTDDAGHAQFPPLPPGTYHLIGGVIEPRLSWNLKVDLQPGSTTATLDRHNASPFE